MHAYLPRNAATALARALTRAPAVLLLGPRQCGKSTLARSLQKLLWPAASEVQPDLRTASRSAIVQVTDSAGSPPRVWTVELEAGIPSCTVDGKNELLPTGSPALHARYRMPVDELLSSDNRDFAHEIAR